MNKPENRTKSGKPDRQPDYAIGHYKDAMFCEPTRQCQACGRYPSQLCQCQHCYECGEDTRPEDMCSTCECCRECCDCERPAFLRAEDGEFKWDHDNKKKCKRVKK